MTENHPITPPQWQVDAWCKQALAMGADVDAVFLEAAAPAPEPGEVEGIAEWLNSRGRMADLGTRDWYFRAATLLQQQAAPVPVSERLPGPEDCDAEGRCWLHLPDMGTEPLWRLTDPSLRSRYHSHWLPANALPLPAPEGGKSQP